MSGAVRLLLDTHVFLWWKLDDSRLTDPAPESIATTDLVLVSAVSAWEVAIKAALGKLEFHEDFEQGVRESGFDRFPIGFSHAAETRNLPDHHRDPFDRMLIAQARVERLTLVSHDALFQAYDIPLIHA